MSAVSITGNLTDTPSIKFTNNGTAVSNFSVAVNKKRGDEEIVHYFDITAWGTLAQNVSESLAKGDRVNVIGNITQDRFEKDGQKRSAVVIVAESVGPDLRWATARVSKAEGGSRKVEDDF